MLSTAIATSSIVTPSAYTSVALTIDTSIFLATDSTAVKKEFIDAFGARIITPQEEACRDSISGIRGGVVDLWTLASTQKIYGSAGSSFSPMAASIGGVPLEIMNVQTATF